KRLGLRQKLLSFQRQRRAAAQSPAFLIQRDAQPLLQNQQSAPQSLLGDEQRFCRSPKASLTCQLDESSDLVGGERGERGGAHDRNIGPRSEKLKNRYRAF